MDTFFLLFPYLTFSSSFPCVHECQAVPLLPGPPAGSPDHAVFVAVTHQGDSNCTCYYSSAQIEKKSTYLLLLCTVVPFPPVSSVCQILMLSLSLLAAVSPWKKHLPAHTPLPGQLGTVPRFCSFILSVIKLYKHYMWFHQY